MQHLASSVLHASARLLAAFLVHADLYPNRGIAPGTHLPVLAQAADVACAEDAAALWSSSDGVTSPAAATGLPTAASRRGWDAVFHASGALADRMLPRQSLAAARTVSLLNVLSS